MKKHIKKHKSITWKLAINGLFGVGAFHTLVVEATRQGKPDNQREQFGLQCLTQGHLCYVDESFTILDWCEAGDLWFVSLLAEL